MQCDKKIVSNCLGITRIKMISTFKGYDTHRLGYFISHIVAKYEEKGKTSFECICLDQKNNIMN